MGDGAKVAIKNEKTGGAALMLAVWRKKRVFVGKASYRKEQIMGISIDYPTL